MTAHSAEPFNTQGGQEDTVTSQDFHARFAPSKCDLRVHLHAQGTSEAEPSEFEQVLFRLGRRYEEAHLSTFPQALNLRTVSADGRAAATAQQIAAEVAVLYQPRLQSSATLNGSKVNCIGEPDFFIRENDGYVVRDVKMARRVDQENHPEIVLQLQFYGWLYRQMIGKPPVRLEVLNGRGEIVIIPDDGGEAVLTQVAEILRLKRLVQPPYAPVGWTKCNACSFHAYCWPKSEATKDVALVYDVDQGLALQLHNHGVETVEQLLSQFTPKSLSEFKRPWGKKLQKVGNKAGTILLRAKMLHLGRELMLQPPTIPEFDHYVMFDLEGMPPHLDELENVYLWGMQVFGKTEGKFMPALAGFGEDGDREGWRQFLARADEIFRQFGDIPFVHWHHYERTHISEYIKRYGDPQGVAARVLKNLLDLLPIARESIVLPLSSYSLKVVEKYVGFKRSQSEYGGSWSMARYIEATETEDENLRRQVMDQILLYNKEDLAATWAVFQWLKGKI
jgi:predicted RecB family nuclease